MIEKRKVVFCGTHPSQFNGYSKVLYEICNGLSKDFENELELYVFGFQNFHSNNSKKDHINERELPNVKEIYDAYANEEPKQKGFGEELITDYIKKINPDIVIIYNDLIVISSLLQRISKMDERDTFKVIPYIDLVYRNEKNDLIKFINANVDGVITFNSYWTEQLKKQNFTKPITNIPHGFSSLNHYPIPKKVARLYYGIEEDTIVIVNLNRNQPRKRWDICLMAFIKFISKHLNQKIKLLIGTTMNGAWDLMDIIDTECRKNEITLEDIRKHIIVIPNPQQLTDKEVNILYNIGDIGINTCDGEGFGLCNFEQAGVGIPQIISRVGGFKEIFHKSNSIFITPKWSYYVDKSRDVVGGEADICDIDDFVKGLEFYVFNEKTRETHGKKIREHITKTYKWSTINKSFFDLIISSTEDVFKKKNEKKKTELSSQQENKPKTSETVSIEEELDINELIKQRYNSRKEQIETSNISEYSNVHENNDDFFIIEG